MKALASILTLLIALHSQCGAQCLGAEAPRPEQPPCHQHAGNPQTPSPDQNPCGQAQTLESKIGPISRCALDFSALEPVTFQPSSLELILAIPAAIETGGITAGPGPNHSAILRI